MPAHPKLLKQATTVGLKYQKRGWVRDEARSQSLSVQNQGHSQDKAQWNLNEATGTWASRAREELALGQQLQGQVAKIRARNFGASWAPPDSSLFLTATSAGCSSLGQPPTAIRGVSAWASPPSLVNALGTYRGSWQPEQRWHRQSGRGWQMVMREISSAPRHWKNHLKKQFITMKLLLLEWKY